VLPALIRKAHEAKVRGDREMIVWGSGNPRREFLFVDDLAEACVMLMEQQRSGTSELPSLINVGCGEDMTIKELAHAIMNVVGFTGDIRFDTSRPDGTPQKLLDIARISRLGWKPKTLLAKGVRLSFDDYLSRVKPS
jgi:GDP-L-fucose synthase